MVSIGELMAECKAELERSGVYSPDFDARCIFEDCLELRNIFLHREKPVSAADAAKIRRMIHRRAQGEPLQYLLGSWDFFGYMFRIGEGVLIPRSDTETLVEQALDICTENGMKSPEIADLCSGSGCIAITLKMELPDAEIHAVELSDKALKYLEYNKNQYSADITVHCADVLNPETAARFRNLDMIVSNPPYLTESDMEELQKEVRCEPEMALYGGYDGLDFYRTMCPVWRESLREGGFILFEFGMGQHEAVSEILKNNGYENIQLRRDAAGIIRTVSARKKRR